MRKQNRAELNKELGFLVSITILGMVTIIGCTVITNDYRKPGMNQHDENLIRDGYHQHYETVNNEVMTTYTKE